MRPETIVITGPESTGKTTLTRQLADHFGCAWAPEFARTYIARLDRPYREDDLLEIAKGQVRTEEEAMAAGSEAVFFDTGLEVIKIWSEYKYGRCHPWILDKIAKRKYSFYLLCSPDIPWQPDPQRENPFERKKIFKLFRQELTRQNTKFVVVNGLNEKRFANAIHHVESYLHIAGNADHAQ